MQVVTEFNNPYYESLMWFMIMGPGSLHTNMEDTILLLYYIILFAKAITALRCLTHTIPSFSCMGKTSIGASTANALGYSQTFLVLHICGKMCLL